MKLRSEEVVITGLARFTQWIPQLDRDDRKKLLEQFNASATWSADFVIMMGLSTALASLGLLLNSTAVVIGAMLVAPLMTPLIGGGFAMVQGNVKLFRASLHAMSYGVFVGLTVSLIIGILTPSYDPTPEMASRGEVNILDLAVALFSGMAAAYATARPSIAATLAGVAIAAALVPPLSVVGMSLAASRFHLAGMAIVLLIANLVTIMVGAAFVFQMMGVKGARNETTPLWARRISLLLIVLVGMMTLPLGQRFLSQGREGQARPLLFPSSRAVREAVHDYLDQQPELRLVMMGRSGVKPELGVGVILTSESPISTKVRDDLTEVIAEALNQEVPVFVWGLQESWVEPEENAEN